jgi:hypothetical protein
VAPGQVAPVGVIPGEQSAAKYFSLSRRLQHLTVLGIQGSAFPLINFCRDCNPADRLYLLSRFLPLRNRTTGEP